MIKRLRMRIGIVVIFLLVIVVISIAMSFENLKQSFLTSSRIEELQKQVLAYSKNTDLNSNLDSLKLARPDQCIIYTDAQTHILYQKGNCPINLLTFGVPGEEQVIRGNMSMIKTSDPSGKKSVYVIGAPIGQPTRGAVFLLEPAVDDAAVFKTFQHELELSVVGGVLLAFAIAIFYIDRMVAPCALMERKAKSIIEGDYSSRLTIDSKCEMSDLGKALNHLADHLKHQEETRAQFISNISHEIRTPLSYIQGYTQILGEGIVQCEKEREKYFQIIQQELKRLKNLLDDLLDLGKLKEPTFKISMEAVDMVPIIHSTLVTLQPYADQNQIFLQYEGPKFLPEIQLDPIRIKQVLINLIQNAIHYSKPNTQVLVRAKDTKQYISIAVEDQGPGIPEKELPYIWERFYRVDKSRNRALGGTGIGLSIVKQIIHSHRGKIHVVSELGKGTTIICSLPKGNFHENTSESLENTSENFNE